MAATLRLYRAARIGTGTHADPFRAALDGYRAAQYATWDVPTRTGIAIATGFYCLALAEPAVHAQLAADANVLALSPEHVSIDALRGWLDGPLGAVSAAVRDAIEGDGIPVDDITATDTRRKLLRRIALYHHAAHLTGKPGGAVAAFFREGVGTFVFQLPAATRNAIQDWMLARDLDTSWILGTTSLRDVVRFIIANIRRPPLSFIMGREELSF